MSTIGTVENSKIFLGIAGGKIVQTVPEGTPGAVKREWEAGGRKGVKFELQHDNITGTIEEVYFYEGESDGRKFTSLNIKFDKGENGKYPVLTISPTTKYGQDLMKKLPGVNFREDVKIRPFKFIPDGEDREVTGVEIKQRDGTGQFNKKINNFFWDAIKKTGKNGLPSPTDEEKENSDWEMYYKRVDRFLVKHTKEVVCSKFVKQEGALIDSAKKAVNEFDAPKKVAYPEEIRPEDIPFK